MIFHPWMLPKWLTNPRHLDPSTWTFVTSEAYELDALVFSAAKGSFYVADANDPDGIVHELSYVGMGLTTSKGPIPFGLGATGSTPNMYSEGVGPIMLAPDKKALTVKDFGGSGLVLSGAFSGGAGISWTIVFFGFPPFTVAIGRMKGELRGTPGVGFSAMPVAIAIDP